MVNTSPSGTGIGVSAALPRGARDSSGASDIDRVAEAIDHRLQDRDHRLEVLAIMPVAEARAVVQLLRHLRIARRARIALVLMEREAARIELRADEIHHR